MNNILNNMYDEYGNYHYMFQNKTIEYIVGFYIIDYKYISGFIVNREDYDDLEYFKRYLKKIHIEHYKDNKFSEVYETIDNINNIDIQIIHHKIISDTNFDYENIKKNMYNIINTKYSNMKLKIIDTFNMKDMLTALNTDLTDNTFEEYIV